MDMYETSKRDALSNFINSAQAAILNPEKTENMLAYTSSFTKLFIYFSGLSLEDIKPFDFARTQANNNATAENFQKANCELSKLVSNLSKQIKKK